MGKRIAVLLSLLTLGWALKPDDRSALDVDVLSSFVLGMREVDGLNVPLNETVEVAVNSFLNRLQCVQQGLTNLECVQCLKPNVLTKIVGNIPEKNVTTTSDIEKLSVVLLNHALTFRYTCSQRKDKASVEACTTYGVCKKQLQKSLPLDDAIDDPERMLEVVENVLREIKGYYEPIPFLKCFSAEMVLSELPLPEKTTLQKLSTKILGHMLKGECVDVGEAVTDFLDDIFLHYGDRCNGIITPTAFEKLMSDLKTQGPEEHETHGTTKNLCTKNGETGTTQRSYLNEEYDVDGVAKDDRKKNMYSAKDTTKRITRATSSQIFNEEHEHRSLASECLSADGLLRKFTLNSSENITPSHFFQLCPALVQQVVSGVCNYDVNATKVMPKIKKPSVSEVYGYSTLAVLIISLTSLCGLVLIPILDKSIYRFTMMIFIGISFGTMAGDAILHLIPQALGIHGHDEAKEEEEDHEGVSLSNIPEYLGIQFAALAAIYIMFIFESTSSLMSSGDDDKDGHGHSHVPEKLPTSIPMKRINSPVPSSEISREDSRTSIDITNEETDTIDSKTMPQDPVIKSTPLFYGFTTMAIAIIIGDVLHNFGDGIAIGASFAPGLRGGLSTSLAVFCHELPHEFGDFIILLSTGLSIRKAMIANFFSALMAFFGLYAGISLGEHTTVRKWIMSATAGVFLFVALTEMLPELRKNKKGDSYKMYLIKHLGILIGYAIMITIAIYEDHFHI